MNKILYVLMSLFLAACGSGDSDSGGMLDNTLPGTNVPISFVGTYRGTTELTASALGLSERDTFDITVTVTADGTVRFNGDDPEETFTVGLQNDGAFAGTLPINEDECQGSVTVSGTVDGTRAFGDVSGSGSCQLRGASIDVSLNGTFEATR